MAQTPTNDDLGATLALAVIAASQAPLLLLDGESQVIAASESFLALFGMASSGARAFAILPRPGRMEPAPAAFPAIGRGLGRGGCRRL